MRGREALLQSEQVIKHNSVKYLFSTGIDTMADETNAWTHSSDVRQFLRDMQTFYELKGEPQTQLQILNDLL